MIHASKDTPFQYVAYLNFNKRSEPTEPQVKHGFRLLSTKARWRGKTKTWQKANKSISFKWAADITRRGIDYNLLLWSSGFETARTLKKYLRPLIALSFPGFRFSLSVQLPRSQKASIKYAYKDLNNRTKILKPSGEWEGKRITGGCRLKNGKTEKDISRQLWKEKVFHSQRKPAHDTYITRLNTAERRCTPNMPNTGDTLDQSRTVKDNWFAAFAYDPPRHWNENRTFIEETLTCPFWLRQHISLNHHQNSRDGPKHGIVKIPT